MSEVGLIKGCLTLVVDATLDPHAFDVLLMSPDGEALRRMQLMDVDSADLALWWASQRYSQEAASLVKSTPPASGTVAADILRRVLAELDAAEGQGGPEGPEYGALMRAVADEALRRAFCFDAHQQGIGVREDAASQPR